MNDSTIPSARPVFIPTARPVDDNPMLLRNLSAGQCVVNLFIMVGMFLACGSVYAMVWKLLNAPSEIEKMPEPGILSTVPVALILMVTVAAIMRQRRTPAKALGISSTSLGTNVALGFAATACSFGIFLLSVGALYFLWPDGYEQMKRNPENIDRMIPSAHPAWLFLLMICVSVYEELLFRGLLLTHFRRMCRSWPLAIFLQAVIFGLLHGQSQVWAATILLAVIGMFWAALTVWRRSLVPAIVAHLLFNSFQLLFLSLSSSTA